jgi:hypothetical protein
LEFEGREGEFFGNIVRKENLDCENNDLVSERHVTNRPEKVERL